MCEQLRFVEREVRRPHHGDGRGTDVRCMRSEFDGVPGRLRARVHGDREPLGSGLDEQLRRTHPLLDRKQESLARRPERQQAVDATARKEVHVRPERVLVQRLAAVTKRSHGRCDRSL